MTRILQCSLVFTVAAALPSSLSGQAMVGYGIMVGRAGAAGVATGAGAAGIFSKLGSTTKQAADQSPSGVARGRQPEFGEDDLKPTVIKLNTGSKSGATATSGKRKMSSGVTISGIPASRGRSAGSQAAAVREVAPVSSGTAGAGEAYGYGSAAPGPYQPVSSAGSAGLLPGSSTTRTCRDQAFGRDRRKRNPAGSSSRRTGWVIFEPRLGIQRFQCPDSSKKLHRHFRRGRSPCPVTTLPPQRNLRFRLVTKSRRSSSVSANR